MEVEGELSPVIRIALTAALTDSITEFEALRKTALCGSQLPQLSSNATEKSDTSVHDTLLQELNKVFFETLVRFEKGRREDYIEYGDGQFHKLNEDECAFRTFIAEVSNTIECFKMMVHEIDCNGSYGSLISLCDVKQRAIDVLVDLARSSTEKEEFIAQIKIKINTMITELANQKKIYRNALSRMRSEWQETRQLSEMTIKYLEAKYRQEADSYMIACRDKEKYFIEETTQLRERASQESRQFSETMNWIFTELDTGTNRMHYLQSKTSVEELSRNLEELRSNLAKKTKEYEVLKKDFSLCEAVVLDCRNIKERERIRNEYIKKKMMCVLQIQAWWRTTIIIRGIKMKKKETGKEGKQKKKSAK